jgi:hypothetical protein
MARGDNMELTLAKGDINVILDDDNHINQDCQSPLVTHSDTSLVPGAWNDNLYQTSLTRGDNSMLDNLDQDSSTKGDNSMSESWDPDVIVYHRVYIMAFDCLY